MASGSQSVGNLGSYIWSSSSQMVADVQDWLDNPAGNYGWLLRAADEGLFTTAKRFDSRENPTASVRPVLSIDYTPIPEPATVLFMATGMYALLRNRRR